MPPQFDPNTAKVFDPKSAKPVEQKEEPTIQDILSGPGNLFGQGLSQLKTNPIAAAINMAHGLLQLPGAAVGGALKGYEDLIDAGFEKAGLGKAKYKPSDLLNSLFGAVAGGEQKGERGLDKLIGMSPEEQSQLIAHTMKVAPERVNEVASALSQLNQTAAQYAAGAAVPKVPGAIKETAGAVARTMIPETLPLRLESSAYKQPYAKGRGIKGFEEPVKIAIKKDIPPTRTALDQLKDTRAKIADARVKATTTAAGEGARVDYRRTLRMMDKIQKDAKGHPLERETVSAIEEAKDRIQRRLEQFPDGKVPVDIADADHFAFQDLVAGKYGEIGSIKQELYKSVSSDILRGITEAEPSVKALGAEAGELAELQKALERRVANLEKSEIIPKGWLARNVLRVAGYTLAGELGAGRAGAGTGAALAGYEALTEMTLGSPEVKHRLAVIFDRARKMGLNPDKNLLLDPSKFAKAVSSGAVSGGEGGSGGTAVTTTRGPVGGGGPTFEENFQRALDKRAPANLPERSKALPEGQKSLPPSSQIESRRAGGAPSSAQPTGKDVQQNQVDMIKQQVETMKENRPIPPSESFPGVPQLGSTGDAAKFGNTLRGNTSRIKELWNQYKTEESNLQKKRGEINKVTDPVEKRRLIQEHIDKALRHQLVHEAVSAALGDKDVTATTLKGLTPEDIDARLSEKKSELGSKSNIDTKLHSDLASLPVSGKMPRLAMDPDVSLNKKSMISDAVRFVHENYPNIFSIIKSFEVYSAPPGTDAVAAYSPHDNSIVLDPDKVSDIKETINAIVHELRHAVDTRRAGPEVMGEIYKEDLAGKAGYFYNVYEQLARRAGALAERRLLNPRPGGVKMQQGRLYNISNEMVDYAVEKRLNDQSNPYGKDFLHTIRRLSPDDPNSDAIKGDIVTLQDSEDDHVVIGFHLPGTTYAKIYLQNMQTGEIDTPGDRKFFIKFHPHDEPKK